MIKACNASLTIFAIVCTITSVTPRALGGGGAVKAAARASDDLLEWIIRVARPATRRTDGAADALEQTIRRMRAGGDDLSETVAGLVRNNYDSLPVSILTDDTLLRVATKHDDLAPTFFVIGKRLPVSRLGSRLEQILEACPQHGRRLVLALSDSLGMEQSQLLLRGVSGREISNSQVQSLIKGIREACDGQTAGEFFELLCRQQINHGAMKPKISLRPGTILVDGRYNAIHGIDGVGVAEDGVPLVLEFTIDESKNLGKTGQLSPAHVVDRWNRLVAQPSRVEILRSAGVSENYLKPIDEVTAKGFHRVLVAHNYQCLNESNRIAADLGMNDLLVLGK